MNTTIRRRLIAVLSLWLVYASISIVQAQAPDNRVALIIGNAAYGESPLRTPVNDARLMSTKLKELGFEIIARDNATRAAMGAALSEFTGKLTPNSTALIYYAGHAIQSRGRNYLIPVDAALVKEGDLRFQAVDVSTFTDEMENARPRMSFLVLDASRASVFQRRMLGAALGLTALDMARGAMVAFASSPGSLAEEADGANSPYTEELVKALDIPNLGAEEMFRRVTAAVARRTDGRQLPWISSSLRDDFVFNARAVTSSITAAAPPPPFPNVSRDALFWQSVLSSMNVTDFEEYLRRYPQGQFAAEARGRIESLKQAQREQAQRERARLEQAQRLAAAAAPPAAIARSTDGGAGFFDGTWAGPFDCGNLNSRTAKMVIEDGVIRQFEAGDLRQSGIRLNDRGGFGMEHGGGSNPFLLRGTYDSTASRFHLDATGGSSLGGHCRAVLKRD